MDVSNIDPSLKAFITTVTGLSGTTVIAIGVKILKVLGKIERRLDQHDMMWEVFCREHNIPNIATLESIVNTKNG